MWWVNAVGEGRILCQSRVLSVCLLGLDCRIETLYCFFGNKSIHYVYWWLSCMVLDLALRSSLWHGKQWNVLYDIIIMIGLEYYALLEDISGFIA